jgi:hypothetical protein
MSGRLSSSDAVRAQTWNSKIAETILGSDYTDIGHDRRWAHSGGFSVDMRNGAWYSFGVGKGGYSSDAMVGFLKPAYSRNEAADHVAAYLDANPGTGPSHANVPDYDVNDTQLRASAARAQQILDTMVPITGTAAETYLAGRRLPGPFAANLLGFVEYARVGEGALVTVLTADDRIAAVQLTYLDPSGRKSLVEPVRQRFNLAHSPGAVAEVQAASLITDIQADVVVAEGIEDALSVAQLGRHWRLVALPGVTALQHVRVRSGERWLIVADGDEPGSPATKGLAAGVDHLLLSGAASVKVTATPLGQDASAILQTHSSLVELIKLIAGAKEAKLSDHGEFESLARLDPVAFDRESRAAAKRLGISIGTLRKEVAKRRPKPTATEEESTAGVLSVPEDPPWAGPIPPLVTVLNTIMVVLLRFIVITKAQAVAITLWVAASHLLQSAKVNLHLFPKLALQSKDPASGKTTLLTLVWNILPRAKLWTYPSGAFLVRAIEQGNPSLCLDELHYAEDHNLLRVINASHQRSLAYVPLLVPNKFGGWEPREFPVWVPMALARLGEFSTAQQSRSIVIWMLPKLPGEKCERLRRPEVPELILCRRQLAAWAETVPAWIDPKIPESLSNRDIDNWEPLLFVAELAGGDWPEQARAMVEELMETERRPTITVRLLSSIWKIFQPDPRKPPTAFITSRELKASLIAHLDEDWATINNGRPITYEYLRERLSHLLAPPGSQSRYYYDNKGQRHHEHGYSFVQFKGANDRYLGGIHPLTLPERPGAHGAVGSDPDEASNPAGSSAPGRAPDERTAKPDPVQEAASESSKSAEHVERVPHEPGAPGRSEGTPSLAAEDRSPLDPEKPRQTGRDREDFCRRHAIDPRALGAILAYRDENPGHSAKRIRKALHIPLSLVELVLREWGSG